MAPRRSGDPSCVSCLQEPSGASARTCLLCQDQVAPTFAECQAWSSERCPRCDKTPSLDSCRHCKLCRKRLQPDTIALETWSGQHCPRCNRKPSRQTRKDCSVCLRHTCSNCGKDVRAAGGAKTCFKCSQRVLSSYHKNKGKGRRAVSHGAAPAPAPSSSLVSTVIHVAPSPSPPAMPSVWQQWAPLSETTLAALRNAACADLLHLLRVTDEAPYLPAIPFRAALESGRVSYHREGGQVSTWPCEDAPRIIRGRDWGVPADLDRICLDATSKKLRNRVVKQVGYEKTAIQDPGDAHHLISTWYRANDLNNVYWLLDVDVGVELNPPADLTMGRVVFNIGLAFTQTANITPKFSFVDAHIDDGVHVLSICGPGCVKLWIVHPPTAHNMTALARYETNSNIIGNFEPLAEGGCCFLQFPGDAVYLPPGAIHTIITIAGGCLTGLTWVSDASLVPSAQILARDIEQSSKRTKSSFKILLQSIDCWLQAELTPASLASLHQALELICSTTRDRYVWQTLDKDKECTRLIKGIEKRVADRAVEKDTECLKCCASLAAHLRGLGHRDPSHPAARTRSRQEL
ncbi:hypothetical protein FB567DRAFT_539286 [Paraphoma chrysanthemicola]|uniref:JmjC domain-containing protein n=1 Tax=Paraphoma chrysanthemicola TaxID=798071 RepID=A0A8K0QTN3_9PLEO|nr:hypothetical protein FB567DRAFT_539286 [Paraphoma chrysanthemicola]